MEYWIYSTGKHQFYGSETLKLHEPVWRLMFQDAKKFDNWATAKLTVDTLNTLMPSLKVEVRPSVPKDEMPEDSVCW
jgi:hypothetical protein